MYFCGSDVRGGCARNALQHEACGLGQRPNIQHVPNLSSAYLPVHRADRVADAGADDESHGAVARAHAVADERTQRGAERVPNDRAERVAIHSAHGGNRANGRSKCTDIQTEPVDDDVACRTKSRLRCLHALPVGKPC